MILFIQKPFFGRELVLNIEFEATITTRNNGTKRNLDIRAINEGG